MLSSHHHHSSRKIVKSFEANALKKRSIFVRFADIMTTYFGTILFLVLNIIFFAAWIIFNSGKIPVTPFDPFPYMLLSVVVSSYAIILSIIVLISQNRESQINSLRQELQLQVNLITEREITKVLKMLKEIRNKVKDSSVTDEELEEMIKEVDTSYIERKLEEQIEDSENPLKILNK